MRTLKLSLISLVALIACTSLEAQTAMTQTTLGAAITSSQTTFPLASTTGITATNTVLYVDNEAMFVNSVPVSGMVGVTRGYAGTKAFAHKTGTMALAAPPAAFTSVDPSGSCTVASGLFAYAPIINVLNGNQWLCSSVTGKVVPGFANVADAPGVTAAVASAAGKITPSGPLFHVTGTAAVTGFNIPVGFDPTGSGPICAIPDALFTTTNANNIALATTAVVSKPICWVYDANSTKFYPSY